jgi:hypothetical protein
VQSCICAISGNSCLGDLGCAGPACNF